ncbi:MAG: imidazolonepropionase [Deltaproteobacteria bacterium]|nr:imidazolonepropionase [Deltaproteobacteria bacterium]
MLLTNISRLVTIESGVIEDAALEMDEGKILWFGESSDAPRNREKFDCGGAVVTPGLIDCHTHLVHAGSREKEYAERAAGKSYLEIAREGGGILSTVNATRAASAQTLYDEALLRLNEAMRLGVTTIEIKSGYGLDVETELKMFSVIHTLHVEAPVTIVPTFLAHIVPEEFRQNRGAYIKLLCETLLPKLGQMGFVKFCDCFVEEEAFTKEEAAEILEAGNRYGMLSKLHVDQLNAGEGAEFAASKHAVSADHLENISSIGMEALKTSGTVAVLLPGASFFLGAKPAPARQLLSAGVPVALATDYNPGTNPCLNLMLTATMGVSLLKMTVEEVWRAITLNAAKALNLEKTKGSIAVGKDADLVLWNAPDEIYPLYAYGRNCVSEVFIKGAPLLYKEGAGGGRP